MGIADTWIGRRGPPVCGERGRMSKISRAYRLIRAFYFAMAILFAAFIAAALTFKLLAWLGVD